ncbi:MAG TPA: outer membrane protein assembly factor BamD, partial [Pyrinomonadaceae bacterium]|nr:outer membrane protein assembly factor BamD [Pyrinomonadaceae bacterium]
RRKNDLNTLWTKATTGGAAREELESARRDLRAYLKQTELERDDWPTAGELTTRQKRNTASDMLDALAALEHGSSPEHVHTYLAARRAYDGWLASLQATTPHSYPPPAPEEQLKNRAKLEADREASVVALARSLDAVPRDKNLDDNVAYLRAAVHYTKADYEEAAASFKSLAARYPSTEKREAALFMNALAELKQSGSYKSDDATAVSSEPCADCRDEAWKAARAGFSRIVNENPRGRFAAEARGWLAFTSLRVGDVAGGLAEYYRILSDETNRQGRAEALNSLAMVRPHADDDALARLEDELADEPVPALTYAYHNIYNYAVDFNIYSYPFVGDSNNGDSETYEYGSEAARRAENKNKQEVAEAQRKEFRRVAEFATRMLRRYPHAATGADFTLRAAAADLELGDNRAAYEFARRALARGVAGERREDALWIKGVAEYRLREYDAARRTLTNLVGENLQGRLTRDARVLLALVAEDAGDFGGALEQYLLLDYKEDAAYFIDVLMSPEQLAAFIASHPHAAQLDELNYALGVRYLRAGRYAEARAAYARVHTSREGGDNTNADYSSDCDKYALRESYQSPCISPKADDYGAAGSVHERWLLRDLKTAETLEWYERSVETAEGDEAKAETLYQMASYLYENDLLFYNPAAWDGSRHYYLYDLERLHNYRQPNEAQLVWDYSQSHDMAARALA